MPFEIRNLTLEDLEEATLLSAQAFASPHRHDVSRHVEHFKQRFEDDLYLGAFEDGEMTSMTRIIPVEMYLNGGTVSLGAVSPVANSPLHRRKGHTGAMLQRSLEQMRECGTVLSGLYTPHPNFYRRYGWEFASEWRRVTFLPKDFDLTFEPSERGRFRAFQRTDWRALDPVFQIYAASRNGPFKRSASWWRTHVTESLWRDHLDVVLWQNDAGEPEGYALYDQPTAPGPDANPEMRVDELVTTSPDAFLNLIAYFGRHDIHDSVTILAAPHDPMLVLFGESEKLRVRQRPAVMLRIVDFEAAMKQRLPARRDDEAEITLHLTDESAPWNHGTWRVSVAAGATTAERTDAGPELALSARALAPLYNGYVSPRAAAATGLLHAESDEAIERASRVFGVTQPPYFTDHF